MFGIKIFILFIIFCTSTLIGVFISKNYTNRVKALKEFKTALIMFETKIKYTYETVPEIFREISSNIHKDISEIFISASNNMKKISAGQAWINSIDDSKISITREDKNVLKGLAKLLGKTDIEGQIQEIKLTNEFLDKQERNDEND